MKNWLLATLIGLAFLQESMAKDAIAWSSGTLLLTNGIEFMGGLNYNWKAEIIQLKRPDGTIKAFSASQVQSFTYFDNRANLLRRFVSVDFPVQASLVRTVILEELAEGPMMIYRRLRHMREPIKLSKPAMYGYDTELLKDYDNFQYMVFIQEDSFVPLENFNLAIWPHLEEEFGDKLRQYIRLHGLDTTNTVSKLMLIAQYNALKQQATKANTSQVVTTAGQ